MGGNNSKKGKDNSDSNVDENGKIFNQHDAPPICEKFLLSAPNYKIASLLSRKILLMEGLFLCEHNSLFFFIIFNRMQVELKNKNSISEINNIL
jgi:hypothetical protein